jgi:hypothetical protein
MTRRLVFADTARKEMEALKRLMERHDQISEKIGMVQTSSVENLSKRCLALFELNQDHGVMVDFAILLNYFKERE